MIEWNTNMAQCPKAPGIIYALNTVFGPQIASWSGDNEDWLQWWSGAAQNGQSINGTPLAWAQLTE